MLKYKFKSCLHYLLWAIFYCIVLVIAVHNLIYHLSTYDMTVYNVIFSCAYFLLAILALLFALHMFVVRQLCSEYAGFVESYGRLPIGTPETEWIRAFHDWEDHNRRTLENYKKNG